jgi:hypothetical protein
MSERLSDDEYRAWIDAGSPNALEAWAIITALRAELEQARAVNELGQAALRYVEEQRDSARALLREIKRDYATRIEIRARIAKELGQ